MKGKMVTLTLAFTMVLTSILFSGCSGQKTTEASKTPTTAESSANPANEKPKQVVTLKMLGGADKFDPQTDLERQRIKDILGYDIIGEVGVSTEKLNLILSSGEEYDIIKSVDKALLAQLIKNKAIQPLNEHIDKFGSNLKKAYPEDMWALAFNEGKQYAIFTTAVEAVQHGIAVRQDWLNKLNMQPPTTPDEFYNMLQAFKEKDPGGVGSKNVIPVSFNYEDYSAFNFYGLPEAFGLGNSLESYVVKDGKLVLSLELPGAKEYVDYLKKLFNEGLMDVDFINNKWTNFEQKLGGGSVGSAFMSCWIAAQQATLSKTNPDSKFVFIEPLKGKDGSQKVMKTSGVESFIYVPNSSKKAAEVIKYANSFLDPENYTKLVIGDEGVHYKNENGKLVPILPEFNKLNLARWFFPANNAKMYTGVFEVRARKVKEMGELWEDVRAKSEKYAYIDSITYVPSLPEVIKYAKPLNEFLKEKIIKLVIDDKADINTFDEIVKEYKGKGGDEVTKAYNAWYVNK